MIYETKDIFDPVAYSIVRVVTDDKDKFIHQKKGKDTCQSILGYSAKYLRILFHGCFNVKN